MFKKLRIDLTVMFTSVIGIIMIILIFLAYFVTKNMLIQENISQFENEITLVIFKLQNENIISDSWLSETEITTQTVIYIEDNNNPLLFRGAFQVGENRKEAVDFVNKKFKDEAVSYMEISETIDNMKIYNNLSSYSDDTVLYTKLSFWSKNSLKTLIMLKYLPELKSELINTLMIFILIFIITIPFLAFTIWILIKRAVRPILENNKRQAEFVAAASHELRSPLSVINASVQAIQTDKCQTDHFTSIIKNECSRMSRLISDMLILASSDSKNWEINLEKTDMDTLIINLYENFSIVCKRENRLLNIFLPDEPLPCVYCDPQRITQLLIILLDNAVSYSDKGSLIAIRASALKNTVTIEIEDHGIGISENDRHNIFNRFYKADKSRSNKMHYGLGLSIAKEISELHNAKLYAKNTPGGGTTFVLELNCEKKIEHSLYKKQK